MDTDNVVREIDVWIDNFTPPVDESTMPFFVDIRAIKSYADSKGVAIVSLTEEEKQQFMIPNPNYRKKRRHGIAAVF